MTLFILYVMLTNNFFDELQEKDKARSTNNFKKYKKIKYLKFKIIIKI